MPEVIEAQRRHLAHAELTTREQAAVTGDDIVLAINQDRDIEVENSDAVGDLPYLLSAVAVRIGRVRLELVDRAVDDRQPRRKAGRLTPRSMMVLHLNDPLLAVGESGEADAHVGGRVRGMASWPRAGLFTAELGKG